MAKGIQNADIVAHKFGLALTKVTNYNLEIVKKEQYKREKIVERQITKTIATKQCKNKERISLSSREKENYKGNTKDDINQDQANDKYLF